MEKTIIDPSVFGIEPNLNKDLGGNFKELFNYISTLTTPSVLMLKEGVYHIDTENCQKVEVNITNTASKKEISKQIHTFALYLKNIKNLEINACGASILFDRLTTGICIENCQNIIINGLTTGYKTPSVFQAEVIKKGRFSAVFSVPECCPYLLKNGKLYSLGAGLKRKIARKNKDASNVLFLTDRALRTNENPFARKFIIKEIKKGTLKVTGFLNKSVNPGNIYVLGTCIRSEVGVFINKSKNVFFNDYVQNYNHSHGVVAQCSENLFFNDISFIPANGIKIASHTDFLHFNSCRGKISVKDSTFCGANDDCINVHGVFFKIKEVFKNKLICSFMHDQTFGFNPIIPGDMVGFYDPNDLLLKGKEKVVDSTLLNDYDVELTFEKVIDNSIVGMGLDNLTAQPDLDFISNDVSFVTTRGVLCTTSGKVKIIGNRFNKTSMPGIFISDDCSSWYESGPVKDILIEENVFDNCGENAVLIKPENKINNGPVHKNITVKNNTFNLKKGTFAINASFVEGLTISGNKISSEIKYPFKFTDCSLVKEENNIID